MKMTLAQFQADARAWQNWNFPKSGATEMIFGINEELGELANALRVGNRDVIRDSLADIGIFGANFANKTLIIITSALEVDPVCPAPSPYPLIAFLNLAEAVGKLNHTVLKIRQGIRGKKEIDLEKSFAVFWKTLEATAQCMGFDFEEILFETWSEVSKRDWRLYPETGIARGNDVRNVDESI